VSDFEEGSEHRDLGGAAEGAGQAGAAQPPPEPETDPELKDAGPPADGPADPEGTSGAEEGVSPFAPEAYDPEGEGPTVSTEE
jgi:hypothetical protein